MADALIGKVVNGYEILSRVGQGGMATVFLARQRSMNRNVALKFLPYAFMNDEAYLQRFEREVRIVAQLEHRNIVPVYDFGEFEDQPYIAMRYMPAGSVEELLAAGRIPLSRVLSIVEQVASALDYAHQNGILHRDLKPSNILLDDGGGVFITDFGIARILGEGGSNITTQGVVGTPSYMSPEQARGEPLDGRSDVYSLGVMLFELITGSRPFDSDTPYSIAVMHVTMPPPSPRDVEPGVTSAVEAVILRALHKQPDKRYATAGELAQALRRAADPAAAAADNPAAPKRSTQPAPSGAPNDLASAGADTSQIPKLRFTRRLLPVRRGRKLWVGAAAGGAIGCLLLSVLLITAVSLLDIVSDDSGDLDPATQSALAVDDPIATATATTLSPTAIATQASADTSLKATLAALGAAADATFTAEAELRQTPPTATGSGIQPVGVRERQTLQSALQPASGELLYFARRESDEGSQPFFEIVTLDLSTWEERRFDAGASSTYPQPSPDGRWIVFQSDRDGDFEIYLANRHGGQLRQLTRNSVWDRLPAWSPDGQWIVYSTDSRGDQTFDLYRMRPTGEEQQPLFSDGWRNSHARYSPGGNAVVFTAGQQVRDASTWELRLLDLGSRDSTLLTANDIRDASPVFSPDGGRILYVTTIGGARALASMNLQGADRVVLYAGPGSVWAASYSLDGRYLIVTATLNGEDQLFLMDAAGGNAQQITTTGGAYASWIPPIAG